MGCESIVRKACRIKFERYSAGAAPLGAKQVSLLGEKFRHFDPISETRKTKHKKVQTFIFSIGFETTRIVHNRTKRMHKSQLLKSSTGRKIGILKPSSHF